MCAQRPKRIFLLLKNHQKPQKLAKLSVIPDIPPGGTPGGVSRAKNHLGLLFGSRLEALTRKSQNLGFQRVQFGCLAPSGAVKMNSRLAFRAQ